MVQCIAFAMNSTAQLLGVDADLTVLEDGANNRDRCANDVQAKLGVREVDVADGY